MSSTPQPQTVDVDELLATFRRAWENAPPEVQAACPSFLTSGTSLIGIWALHENTIAPTIQVIHYLEPTNVCSPQAAKFLIQQARNNTGVLRNEEVLVECMSSDINVPYHVQADILTTLQRSANMLLMVSTVFPAVQVMIIVNSLWELHASVKEARNLTNSSKEKLEPISSNLKVILEKLTELDKILLEVNRQDTSLAPGTSPSHTSNRVKAIEAQLRGIVMEGKSAELEKILLELNQHDIAQEQVSTLTMLFNKTSIIKADIDSHLKGIVNEIGSLEVEINSNKVRLGAARKQAYVAGINSLVSGATSAISVGLLMGVASPEALGITGVVTVCNLVLGAVCPTYAYITGKELEQIQVRLDNIWKVKAEVEEFERKLQVRVRLIYNEIDERKARAD